MDYRCDFRLIFDCSATDLLFRFGLQRRAIARAVAGWEQSHCAGWEQSFTDLDLDLDLY